LQGEDVVRAAAAMHQGADGDEPVAGGGAAAACWGGGRGRRLPTGGGAERRRQAWCSASRGGDGQLAPRRPWGASGVGRTSPPSSPSHMNRQPGARRRRDPSV